MITLRIVLILILVSPVLWAAESPTGRTPKLLWTPERQDVYQRMKTENHRWWQFIQTNADTPGHSAEHFGEWDTLAFQITGDRQYAQKAWTAIQPRLKAPKGANDVRQNFIVVCWTYDWLYPGLTPDQRAEFRKDLSHWVEHVLFNPKKKGKDNIRFGDSDETIGQYFGLALYVLAVEQDEPDAKKILETQFEDEGVQKSVGGLDSTGINRLTSRNTIRDYVTRAEGGVWIESSQYNLNTPQILFTGAEGVRTATGVDHFPEITRILPQFALEEIYQLAPTLKAAHQWGDNEEPRGFEMIRRLPYVASLAGLLQGTKEGAYMQKLTGEFLKADKTVPWFRCFLFYNPYAPELDWRNELPKGYYASGMGTLFYHDGWDPKDSFLTMQFLPQHGVDHSGGDQYQGDFQLFRKGEWIVTHPLAYGQSPMEGDGNNSMLMAGLSSMRQRGPIAQEFGPKFEYAYLAGSTLGPRYIEKYNNPPPPFLHEWTRSLFYIPSSHKKIDTLVVFDRTNADDPKKLPGFDRYVEKGHSIGGDANRIKQAPALKQWIIHSVVSPKLQEDSVSWSTPQQEVRVSTLLPLKQKRTVYDENEIYAGQHIQKSELHFQTRITPEADQKWDTFLNIVQAYDSGQAFKNILLQNEDKEVQGVLIHRDAESDVAVLFGANPSSRLHQKSFSISLQPMTSECVVYFLDLDPAIHWYIGIDSGGVKKIEVTSQGVGQVKLSGTQLQKLTLSPSSS